MTDKITVRFGEKTFEVAAVNGATGLELIKDLKVPPDLIGYKHNGEVKDFHMIAPTSGVMEVFRNDAPEAADVIRHSAAHVLAQAVKSLYPHVQVTIGPVIENGFFYDFSKKDGLFKEEDLKAIEEKMTQIIDSKLPVKREEWSVEKACEFFTKQGEHYKVEIIKDIADKTGCKTVSVYWHADQFVDLCRGPHVPRLNFINSFKLMSVAGAYWRGNEKNEMLSRIYGIAFSNRDQLKAHLLQIEEAKKRDHRRIGTDQSLFSFHAEAPASPFFHPNGAHLFIQMQDFLRDINRANGFQEVISPLIMSQELWKKSGHYDNYRENMYFTDVDERPFAVKPMNCPGHCLMYAVERHSYRELPLRYSEFGRVHRHERSGVTAGLFRVRSFVQDDAHVFCTTEQIKDEIIRVLGMIRFFYTSLGFSYHMELSTRPEKRIGAEAIWDAAEAALADALKSGGYAYKINPGDGAFYGPKIDFHLRDSIGRTHQCGTIQLDFSMPERFGLEYSGSDNHAHIPVMIHRAIAGSLERFLGIFIEHVAGLFPFWMAPKQFSILTVAPEANDFAFEVRALLQSKGYRVLIDDTNDKLAGKVKRYQPMKIPYTLVIGAKEAQAKQVSIRTRDNQQRQAVSLDDLLNECAALARPQIETVKIL